MSTGNDDAVWKEYDTFKGDSDVDIGSLLQELQSQDPATREKARLTISQWPHEGLEQIGRLGAIPLAIEKMLELLKAPETKERGPLLHLIIGIVRGANEFVQFSRWYVGTSDNLLESISGAFGSAQFLFSELLVGDDAQLRAAAATALSVTGTSKSQGLLVDQLRVEADGEVRRAIIATLKYCGTVAAIDVVAQYRESDDVSTREAACSTICFLAEPHFSSSLRNLCEMATIGIDIDVGRQVEDHADEVRVMGSAVGSIVELGEFTVSYTVGWFLSRATDVPENSIVELFRRLLMIAFWNDESTHHRPARELLPHQKQALEGIRDCRKFWNVDRFIDWRRPAPLLSTKAEDYRRQCLEQFGVPGTREELKRYLSADD